MNSKLLRLISFLLVSLMIITSFASCTGTNVNDDQTEDQSQSDVTTEIEDTNEETSEELTTNAEESTEPIEEDTTVTTDEVTEEETEEETTAEYDDGVYSRLTGLPTTAEIYYQRPVGVMINNLKRAFPSGDSVRQA